MSGETGTKLKTEIVENYYRFWLSVTTGGLKGSYAQNVHIVEMNAGTGQVKIEESGEIILGSAGHAFDLRYGDIGNKKLHIILVEPMAECRISLQNVILTRWPEAKLQPYEPGWLRSTDGCVSLFESLDYFLNYIDLRSLGNSLFFFDPLLAPNQSLVDYIASIRIHTPYKTGTEFLIFFFTSDWVLGRTEFSALPKTKSKWTQLERESALTADKVFGNRKWIDILSKGKKNHEIEEELVALYKQSLRRWFRYVQPLPFRPKSNQRYDVFCCSNYDVGMTVINKIYGNLTWPHGLQKKARTVYPKFIQLYPHLVEGLGPSGRPVEWKVLWHVMKNHIDGVCDRACKGMVSKIAKSHPANLKDVLEWLQDEGYLKPVDLETWPWSESQEFPMYAVDWTHVKSALDVNPPIPPRALKPGDLDKVRMKSKEGKEQQDEEQTSISDFF